MEFGFGIGMGPPMYHDPFHGGYVEEVIVHHGAPVHHGTVTVVEEVVHHGPPQNNHPIAPPQDLKCIPADHIKCNCGHPTDMLNHIPQDGPPMSQINCM